MVLLLAFACAVPSAQAKRFATQAETTAIDAAVAQAVPGVPSSCLPEVVEISTVDAHYAVTGPSPSTWCDKFLPNASYVAENMPAGWSIIYRGSNTTSPSCTQVPGDVIADLIGPSECWQSWLIEHPPAVPASTSVALSCGPARSPTGTLFDLYVPTTEGSSACTSARSAVFTWHGIHQWALQKPWAPFGWTYFVGSKLGPGPWTYVWERSDQKVVALGIRVD